jgi:hypothetical protein
VSTASGPRKFRRYRQGKKKPAHARGHSVYELTPASTGVLDYRLLIT